MYFKVRVIFVSVCTLTFSPYLLIGHIEFFYFRMRIKLKMAF